MIICKTWRVEEKAVQEQTLIEKIQQLPPDKQAAVEDFVDFLSHREEYRRLTQAAAKLSEEAFSRIWENEADAAYDNL